MLGKAVAVALGGMMLLAGAVGRANATPIFVDTNRSFAIEPSEVASSVPPTLESDDFPSALLHTQEAPPATSTSTRAGFKIPDLPVPEPSTILLFGISGLALLKRIHDVN